MNVFKSLFDCGSDLDGGTNLILPRKYVLTNLHSLVAGLRIRLGKSGSL